MFGPFNLNLQISESAFGNITESYNVIPFVAIHGGLNNITYPKHTFIQYFAAEIRATSAECQQTIITHKNSGKCSVCAKTP